MQALGMSPGIAAQDYADIAALQGVGAQKEMKGQQYITDAMQRFGAPADQLRNYINMITGAGGMGGTMTSQQPIYGGSPLIGAAGGALTGAGLASSLGWSTPWGAAIGGGLGLLGGL